MYQELLRAHRPPPYSLWGAEATPEKRVVSSSSLSSFFSSSPPLPHPPRSLVLEVEPRALHMLDKV